MYQFLQARVTADQQNPAMGFIPPHSIIFPPFLSVPTRFNAAGTDFIRVGNADNDDAYGEDKDVSSAITYATFTIGSEAGYTETGKEVFAKYTFTSTDPDEGLAIVVLPFIRIRRS